MEFEKFISKCNDASPSDEFEIIHDQINLYIKQGSFGKINKLFNLFNHKEVDAGTLKALLVSTKSFKNHQDIMEKRKKILELLETKVGKLF